LLAVILCLVLEAIPIIIIPEIVWELLLKVHIVRLMVASVNGSGESKMTLGKRDRRNLGIRLLMECLEEKL
jgi:hypothetical protein